MVGRCIDLHQLRLEHITVNAGMGFAELLGLLIGNLTYRNNRFAHHGITAKQQ